MSVTFVNGVTRFFSFITILVLGKLLATVPVEVHLSTPFCTLHQMIKGVTSWSSQRIWVSSRFPQLEPKQLSQWDQWQLSELSQCRLPIRLVWRSSTKTNKKHICLVCLEYLRFAIVLLSIIFQNINLIALVNWLPAMIY